MKSSKNKTTAKRKSGPRNKNNFPIGSSERTAFENVRIKYETGQISGEKQGEKAFAKELKKAEKANMSIESFRGSFSGVRSTYSPIKDMPIYIKQTKLQSIKKKPKQENNLQTVNKQPHKNKYVPKQLILDDIREYRSSKIISNISDGLATILMKATSNQKMTNFEMNLVRSSVALVTSEVFNKALEKPLKVIDNIIMFIKIGKAIYKVILWFNDKIEYYEMKEESVKKVSSFSSEYRHFLQQNPKIKKAYKNQIDFNRILGKKVEVIIDRPLGSKYQEHENSIYELNYGYIEGLYTIDGKEQEAYIIGENSSLLKFKGVVIAIVIRLKNLENKVVVAARGKKFSRQEILDAINFQEQFFEIELNM